MLLGDPLWAFMVSTVSHGYGVSLNVGCTFIAGRLLHTSSSVSKPVPTSSTSPDVPITAIAKQGSTQLSLETPQNRAGAFVRKQRKGKD